MNITEFDFDTLPNHPFIVFCSKRRSGKSVAIKDITYSYFIKKKKYRRIYVCSPTALLTKDYDFIQSEFIFEEFDEDFLDTLIEIQKTDISADPKGKNECLLILDDIANSTDRKTIDLLGKLSAIGRHLKVAVLLATQNFKKEISPLIRTNLDIMVVWKQSNLDNNKDILVQYLGGRNKEEGYTILDLVPKGYRCMVIDNTKTENQFDEYIYWKVFKENAIPKNYKHYR